MATSTDHDEDNDNNIDVDVHNDTLTDSKNENDITDTNVPPELTHNNSAFEVVEKDEIAENVQEEMNEINISNLSAIAPNGVFSSFSKEYVEALIKRLNQQRSIEPSNEEQTTTTVPQTEEDAEPYASSSSMDRLKNIGGTLAQQLPALFDATQIAAVIAQFKTAPQTEPGTADQSADCNHNANDNDNHIHDEQKQPNHEYDADDDNDLEDNNLDDNDNDNDTENDNHHRTELETHTEQQEEEEEEDADIEDEDAYEYEYYHTKMNHDIMWNPETNDELFIISKDLFDTQQDPELLNHLNVYHTKHTQQNNGKNLLKLEKHSQSNSKTKPKPKSKQKHKWKRRKSSQSAEPQHQHQQQPQQHEKDEEREEEKENVVSVDSNNKSGFAVWTQSFNTMLTHAKHKMYSMLANPSLKWDSRSNRHLFSLSHDVWIMGNHYVFDHDHEHNTHRQNMQSIVLDIYSKIWITYRSKFAPILSSRYTSDAGWGCMLRTTQMMTAQALIILHFDYAWNLTKLNANQHHLDMYYTQILSLFHDTPNVEMAPLSIHNMISYGSMLYSKPVGHWYGPMQSCIMISKCIEHCAALSDRIECIVSDSGVIYKSDFSLKKHALIFLPLRLGLDSLNANYIPCIKRCFHLKECIGIVGGKPQRSLYFIGYQNENLFYLDPHTVFPTPNIHKPLRTQKCVFHCQEINSLNAKQLDPSMAVAFFIKPTQKDLDAFWRSASELINHEYSIFSLADQRPNYAKSFDDDLQNDQLNDNDSNHHNTNQLNQNTNHGDDSDFDNDDEWEKIF